MLPIPQYRKDIVEGCVGEENGSLTIHVKFPNAPTLCHGIDPHISLSIFLEELGQPECTTIISTRTIRNVS